MPLLTAMAQSYCIEYRVINGVLYRIHILSSD